MKNLGLLLIATTVILGSPVARTASAGLILDQSNIVTTFQADYAVVSSQAVGQTFTVGLGGVLGQVNVEIYKSSTAVNDPTLEILGTTAGAPDSTKVLYSTTISLSSIPTFDNPPAGTVPFTSVDVSGANLVVTPGEILAIALIRTGPGVPPWLLWRQGNGGYAGGNSYTSSTPTGPWKSQQPFSGGFQTFILSPVPEPSSVVLSLIGLGGLLVPLRLRARRPTA